MNNNRVQGSGFRVQKPEEKLSPIPYPLSPKKGFTIIEFLLAAVIMSMISLAFISSFGAGLRAFERVQAFGGFQADVLVFLEGLERDVRNTFAFSPMKFQGNSRGMSFAAVGTKLDEEGNEFTVLEERSYDFDSSRKALISKEEDFAPTVSSATDESVRTQQIAPIKSVEFQYYSYRKTIEESGEEKIESSWQGTWTDEEIIPRGVKIILTFDDGGEEVSLARTVFIPSGGDIGDDEEEEEEGDGSDGQGDV